MPRPAALVELALQLLALLLEREDRDEYGEHFEVEHKEEEVRRGTLLPSDLEVAVLEPLEVEAGEPGEEVEAELHGLDFLDDQLDYLQRVALLVDLLDDEGLLDSVRGAGNERSQKTKIGIGLRGITDRVFRVIDPSGEDLTLQVQDGGSSRTRAKTYKLMKVGQ